MAPSMLSQSPTPYQFPTSPPTHSGRTFVSHDEERNSTTYSRRHSHRTSRRFSSTNTSEISDVVQSLKRRNSEELGPTTSAKLLNITHEDILDWIHAQRMSHLPPEGSSYDKVLAWAQLFVDRLSSFNLAIEEFAADSYLATQLTYGYCLVLLNLGKENSSALMTSFAFFYNMSLSLANLLERTELFTVSQDIREQLIMAMSDLVTLVASVSVRFHNATLGVGKSSVSVDIYSTFPGEIKTFVDRCERTAESMWKHQLSKEGLDTSQAATIKAIKTWLSPEDQIHGNSFRTVSHLAQDREELTCLWMAGHLTRFLKGSDMVMNIHGPRGCGKSVLASVIVDYLQHPIGGQAYKTIYIPINNRVPAETSLQSVAKSILGQLFDQRIGNIQLLQTLSEAMQRCEKITKDSDYEKTLWDTVECALKATLPGAKELILVVDGIDEATCPESELRQRLSSVAMKGVNTRLIALGIEKPEPANGCTDIAINSDLILDDIIAVIRGHLETSKSFASMSALDQNTVVSRLAQAAEGSFLWAKFATRNVRHEDTPEKLHKAVDSLLSANLKVFDFVSRTIHSHSVTDGARHMLLWLATAERPLSPQVLSTLASIDTDSHTVANRHVDVLATLKPVNSLVFLQDGLSCLRHGQIREAILDLWSRGKMLPHVKDRHADLAIRLLFYIRTVVTQSHEPSLMPLDKYETSQLLAKYPLLDFAIRHWPYHLRCTSTYTKDGDAAAAKLVSNVFPTSATMLLLQNTLWTHKTSPMLLQYQATVTNICRHISPKPSPLKLQSIISLVLVCRELGLVQQSIPLYYEAITMSRALLTTSSHVTMQLSSGFLEVSASLVTSEKTEIMKKRGDVYEILIECYKVQYGHSSELVITTVASFAEHYRFIGEETKSREITASLSSTERGESAEQEGNLHVHLTKRRTSDEKAGGTRLFLEVEERDELISVSKEIQTIDFDTSISEARSFIANGQVELAEHTFVETWQMASLQFQRNGSSTWERRKLESVIAYAEFLKSAKREHDASSVLYSFWEAFKARGSAVTDTSAPLLFQMANMFKALKLPIQSLHILRHCSAYYQEVGSTQDSTYKEIHQSIHVTSREILQSATPLHDATSEAMLEELILEAATSINTMDSVVFTAAFSLVRSREMRHQWQDATRFIKKVLHGIWPALTSSTQQDVMPPPKHLDSCTELALHLADCHHARRRMVKEEDLLFRLYHCLRATDKKVDDELRETVTSKLLELLSQRHQVDRVIEIRQEVMDDYTKQHSSKHPRVVQMLRELAELARPRPCFVAYYERIIQVLDEGSETCSKETLQPCMIVATELWNKGQFSEALPYYKLLFNTFMKQPRLHDQFQDASYVEQMFNHYTYCIRQARGDLESLHHVCVQYRTQCRAVFGSSATITVRSTMTLAQVCQDSRRYEHEAIVLYEELAQTKSDIVDHREITITLNSMYEDEANSAASSKIESATSTQIERASSMLMTRMTSVRETHGWAHEETLSQLTELVKLRTRQKQTQVVLSVLKESLVHVVSTEKSSYRLMAAASTIATNYLYADQARVALGISEELYRQIVMKDTTNSASFGFELSTQGRESLAFLAQFESNLRRNSTATTSTDQILGELMTQFISFESFRKLIASKNASFHMVTVATSKLNASLEQASRQDAIHRVLKDYRTYFLSTEAKYMQNMQTEQVDILLRTLLQHFSTHQSSDFIRSVGISTNARVDKLLDSQDYKAACDLATAAFTYISNHKSYRTPVVAKLVLIMGMAISGRHLQSSPDKSSRERMLRVSGTILPSVLHVLDDMDVSIEEFSLAHLSSLIGLLGAQHDYHTLAWLLEILWKTRENKHQWSPTATMALGRRYALSRFLTDNLSGAVRLGEDIMYNCRRVHGILDPSTLELSTFLTQLYSSVAQQYQRNESGRDMAARYYKKAVAVHENIVRALIDPAFAELESGGDVTDQMFHRDHDASNGGISASTAQSVQHHLKYMKLSLQRLGSWPKDRNDYLRLNRDILDKFATDYKLRDGVDQWNLGQYGSGKAESDVDLLEVDGSKWEFESSIL